MSGEESPRQKGGLIIAIDGPSGAGKSTITRLLAQRLGYLHLDTGAMYRAMALGVQRAHLPPDDDEALAAACRAMDIRFIRANGGYRILLNGEDVSAAIRTPEISLLTSQISARKVVRDILVHRQRELGREGGVILEGRDIGTVVFPDAHVKFFLSATAEERGRRRHEELMAKGEAVSLATTIAEVVQRDAQDAGREHGPLCRAEDAMEIDSTLLSVDDVLALMEQTVHDRLSALSLREKG